MPNYRRASIPGGTYFFTVVTHRRRRLFHLAENRMILGDAIRECQRDWPFLLNAVVLLPDHWHAIWTSLRLHPLQSRQTPTRRVSERLGSDKLPSLGEARSLP
nr:transposase [Rubinisphaera italica]